MIVCPWKDLARYAPVIPEDTHMPSRHIDEPNEYVTAVVKLKV